MLTGLVLVGTLGVWANGAGRTKACRRASREGDPELAGWEGFRREGQNVSKDTGMEPSEEEIDRRNSPRDPTTCQEYWRGRPGGARAEIVPALAGDVLVCRKSW